jgi:hypothetical protein
VETSPVPTHRTAGGAPSCTPATRARVRLGAGVAGVLGPGLLLGYFLTPALVGWPGAATTPAGVAAYAVGHSTLFYLGGWLQVTGAVASVVLFVSLVWLAGATTELAGLAVIIGAALLLAVVSVESAFLEAVPMAAVAGDQNAASTAFLLSNGVFVRIFPLAPAPLMFAGIGVVLRRHALLPRPFGPAALVVALGFSTAGLAAIFSGAGVVFAIVMSVIETGWIAAAAVALMLTRPLDDTNRTRRVRSRGQPCPPP